MNDAPTADPVAAPAPARSPVLNEARTNLFRTLRLPVAAGVDDAVWKAEELLTLLRAGIPCGDPDPAPWLPAPGEPEIRAAVQAAEEPLRRLLARLSWFDFDADPAGDALRRAVATLAPADLDAFLTAPVPADDIPPPRARTADATPVTPTAEWTGEDAVAPAPDWTAEDGVEPARPGSGSYRAVVRELNRANLLLLLAGRAISDGGPRDQEGAALAPKWVEKNGVRVAVNPHAADPTVARAAAQLGRAADLWTRALEHWGRLLGAPAFKDFVSACLTELNDDLIDPEDSAGVINALWTRLTDLVAGEVRAQLGEGRAERAAALLKVAGASGIEARKWVLALRSLRPRFKAELSELDVLVTGPTTPRLDDVELYIGRVEALARRWAALDPSGLLGLGEITDEAVTRAVGLLGACQEYPIADRVRGLIKRAGGAADAGSVKSKAAAAAAQMDGLKEYACHFCRKRDLDLHCSTVITGKKETGRTTYGNTTTVYYAMKYALVPRCPRCAEMHEYLRWIGYVTWAVLIPLAAVLAYTLIADPYPPTPAPKYAPKSSEGFPPLVTGAFILAAYIASGFVARVTVSGLITPRGERGYADVYESKGHQGLTREGFTLTLDYSKGAYRKVAK